MFCNQLEELERQIEEMRKRLHDLLEQRKYDFLDKDVTFLSQKLDLLIVQYQRCKMDK